MYAMYRWTSNQIYCVMIHNIGVAVCCMILLLMGCHSRAMQVTPDPSKFDAPLRQKLAAASADEPISCLVKLTAAPTEAHRLAIDETGVDILSEIQEIITVQGPPEAIRRLAGLDFIQSIALSQRR